MKNKKHLFFASFLAIFFAVTVQAGTYEEEILELSQSLSSNIEKAKKHTVAVVDFTDLQGNVTGLGRFISEELSSNLVNVKKGFVVIDRLHLKHIINEHKLSVSAFFDPKAVENFGKISGVDAIIIGAVTPFGDSVRVSAKVIATDTATIIAASTGNIARTAAINDLLARGIESSRLAVEGQPTIAHDPPGDFNKSTKIGDITVTLERVIVSKKNQVRAILDFHNESDEAVAIVEDHFGTVNYPTITDEIGTIFKYKGGGIKRKIFLNPKARSKATLYFEPTANEVGSVFSLNVPLILGQGNKTDIDSGVSFVNIKARKLK